MITKAFNTYEEVKRFIRKYEGDNGYKFNMRSVAMGFKDKLSSMVRRKVGYGRENLPYLYVSNGVTTMSCALGGRTRPDRSKKEAGVSTTVTGKRKRSCTKYLTDESGNHLPMCPASIKILSLIYFPDYPVLDGMSKEVLTRHVENLRKEFCSETICVSHFIVEIDESHSYHRKNAEAVIDSGIIERMQNLVERGYYTPSDILEQLDKYYQTLPVKPDKTDLRFYPGIDRVRSLTYFHMMKQRNTEREKGFTADFTEAYQKMAVFENKTLTSYICSQEDVAFGQNDVYRAARTNPVLTIPDAENRCRLDTGGVPYIILGTQLYDCSHGVAYKHKFRDPYTPEQRKHVKKDGMVMCTARCTFKEIALFPAYRVDNIPKERHIREAIMQKLQEDLRNCTAPYERGIAYAFPCVDEHCGHFVKETDGHLYVDERVKSQIAELVSEEVRSVAEMKRHLKMFLKHMFGENNLPGPFSRKYRPSNQTIINLMYQAGAPIEEIIIDVKDPVSYTHVSNFLQEKSDIEVGHENDEIQIALSNVPDKNGERNEFNELLKSVQMEQMKQNGQLNNEKKAATKTSLESRDVSHFVSQKRSECQTLLEEILQSVYAMSDMFRLRDLKELLKRVTVCLKEGKLMCEGIPVNEKSNQRSVSQKSRETFPGDAGVTEVSVPETSEEPPTKVFIIDEHEKVTEVNVGRDHESGEIVLYQGCSDSGEDYIVIDENRGTDQDNKELNSVLNTPDETSVKSKDNEKKGLIKVTCKDYFTTEQILKSLQIEEKVPKLKVDFSDKLPLKGYKNLSGFYDLKTEKKNQEKEMLKYEKDKVSLSKMERKLFRSEGLQMIVPKKEDSVEDIGECKVLKSPLKTNGNESIKQTNESKKQTWTRIMDVDDTCTTVGRETKFTIPAHDSIEQENNTLEAPTVPIKKERTEEELLVAKTLASRQTDHSYNRIADCSMQDTALICNPSFLAKQDTTHDGRKTCIENVTDITLQIKTMINSGPVAVGDLKNVNRAQKHNKSIDSYATGRNVSGDSHQSKEAPNKVQIKAINLCSNQKPAVNEMIKSTKSARVTVFKVSQSPRSSPYSCAGNSKDGQKKKTSLDHVKQDSYISEVPAKANQYLSSLAMKKRGGQIHFSRTGDKM